MDMVIVFACGSKPRASCIGKLGDLTPSRLCLLLFRCIVYSSSRRTVAFSPFGALYHYSLRLSWDSHNSFKSSSEISLSFH